MDITVSESVDFRYNFVASNHGTFFDLVGRLLVKIAL